MGTTQGAFPTTETPHQQAFSDQTPQIPVSAETVTAVQTEAVKRTNAELLELIIAAGENAQSYAKQVVEGELAKDAFNQDQRLAKIFATSGVFADIKGTTELQAIATAMTKIQLGRSWGMSPADAMQFIYFTNGRPAVMTEAFAAKLKEAGYDWDTAFHWAVDKDRKTRRCVGCTILPKRWNPETKRYEQMMAKERSDSGALQDVQLEVSFTKEDADGAMIWEKGKQIKLSEKWNFQSWSEDMYFWRALSRFRRRYAPNVLSGATTREEAEEVGTPQNATPAPLFQKPGQQSDGTLAVERD